MRQITGDQYALTMSPQRVLLMLLAVLAGVLTIDPLLATFVSAATRTFTVNSTAMAPDISRPVTVWW